MTMMQNESCPHCQAMAHIYDNKCSGCNIRHLTRSLPKHRSDYFKQLKKRGKDVKPHQAAMLAIREYDKINRTSAKIELVQNDNS